MVRNLGDGSVQQPVEKKTRGRPALRRVVHLDLWQDSAADLFPEITVTGQGLKLEGTAPDFRALIKEILRQAELRG